MFEKYSEKARRAVFFARYEASNFGGPRIEVAHLLLGLARESPWIFQRRSKVGHETLRRTLEALCTRYPESVPTSVDLPISHACRRVLTRAAEESERMRQRSIGPEHLLLGVLLEDGPEAQAVRGLGIDLEDLREPVGQAPAASLLVSRKTAYDLLTAVPEERLEAAVRLLEGLSAGYFTVTGVSSAGRFEFSFGASE